MKLYAWIEGEWVRWGGCVTLADVIRDRAALRRNGYCTCVVKA